MRKKLDMVPLYLAFPRGKKKEKKQKNKMGFVAKRQRREKEALPPLRRGLCGRHSRVRLPVLRGRGSSRFARHSSSPFHYSDLAGGDFRASFVSQRNSPAPRFYAHHVTRRHRGYECRTLQYCMFSCVCVCVFFFDPFC